MLARKSVVLLTPMIWLEELKLAANPPPFEFCTSTTRVVRIQVTKIKTVNTINIFLAYYEFEIF